MRRSVLILIIAAAVLLIAGIILLALWPEKVPEQDINADPTPTPMPPLESGDLIRVSYYDVDSIDMMPRDSKHYSLRLNRTDAENPELDLIAENSVFKGMQPLMLAMFSHVTTLIDLPRVSEAADDEQLELYGFSNPIVVWRVNLADGNKVEFALGHRLAADPGFYIRNTESRDVYAVHNDVAQFLLLEVTDIYDIFFFPYPPSGDEYETWDLIEHLILERPGDETIELIRRDDEEWFNSPLGISRYRLVQPFESECSDTVVKSVLLEPVTNIIPERVITVNPGDLSEYGLDNPVRLTIATSDWQGTLLIGNPASNPRGWYIMIEGYDAVLLDPHGNYAFLGLDPAQLRTQLTWVHHIDTVSSIEFDLDGEKRMFKLFHPSAGSDDELQGLLDDMELSDRNTRRLFGSAMSIPSSGSTDEPVPAEPPVYSMKMNFTNGGSQTLELYSISDSQFLMAVDGTSLGVYTTRMQIQMNLLSRFETLDAGEDLQMR
ncbi:MAG: DUF4340 domain-containing protein [Oscillospiraceae bacterium]|nr:DUF4340 domain-containing protein [Oscillospiraceae bacterium]